MLYTFLAKSARKYPEKPALITSKNKKFSYKELLNHIHQWAFFLKEKGIAPQQSIGFLSECDDLHVFIYLALDCLGAVYVPLDIETPTLQLVDGLKILNLDHLLIGSSKKIAVPVSSIMVDEKAINWEEIPTEKPKEARSNSEESITYVMSSSGSTGDKKWIPIQGKGLIYWAEVEADLLGLTAEDKILSTRSPAFDARISEYLRAFAHGACLYLMSHQDRKDIQKIIQISEKNKINVLLMVPSQLESSHFNAYLPQLKASELKHLIVTGEACNWTLAKVCKQTGIKLWNAYGPTEATFGLSLLEVSEFVSDSMDETQPVPIGKPILPMKCSVDAGVLIIHSPFITPGYLGAKPFQNESAMRSFNTGDLFSENEHHLIYHGRAGVTTHAKVAGVKVNPLYIEAIINKYADIQSVVVVNNWLGHQKPLAYIKSESNLDKDAFWAYLIGQLTRLEMPICLSIKEFPRLSSSDKIDRRNLCEREINAADLLFKLDSNSEESISDPLLVKMLLHWKQLFKLESLSASQDFFTLGGDSITANLLVGLIQKTIDPAYRYSDFLSLASVTPQNLVTQLQAKRPTSSPLSVATPIIQESSSDKIVFMIAPLLGEARFTYQNLARRYARTFNVSVYGVSSKLISDDGPLPESLEEEAEQFYAAIKQIQAKPPYRLFGFSYGATLAYQVAACFLKNNEKVVSLELMDGFPPLVMQRMSASAHVVLLYSLLKFVIDLFNKHYDEKITFPLAEDKMEFKQLLTQSIKKHLKTQVPILANVDKQAIDINKKYHQISLCFSLIREQIKNDSSLHILNLAERHLILTLAHAKPSNLLDLTPIVYQSSEEQDYWKATHHIKGLTLRAPNHRHLFWNNYFPSVRRNGTQIPLHHLELLLGGSEQLMCTPEVFWSRDNDKLFNLNYFYGPYSFYTVEIKENQCTYNLHFLRRSSEILILKGLNELGVCSKQLHYDVNHEFMFKKDALFVAMTGFQFTVPLSRKAELDAWLQKIELRHKELPMLPSQKVIELKAAPEALYLTVFWNITPLLDFSFDKAKLSRLENTKLRIPEDIFFPEKVQAPNSYSFVFFHRPKNSQQKNVKQTIEEISVFLGYFIDLINAQINEDPQEQLAPRFAN